MSRRIDEEQNGGNQPPNNAPGIGPPPPMFRLNINYGIRYPGPNNFMGNFNNNPNFANRLGGRETPAGGLPRLSLLREFAQPDSTSNVVHPQRGYSYNQRNDISNEHQVHSTSGNNFMFNGQPGLPIPVLTSNDNTRRRHQRFNQIRRITTNRRRIRGVLFLTNLGFYVDEGHLSSMFGAFGRLLDVVVHRNMAGYSLGSAEVVFSDLGDAARAQRALSGIRGMVIKFVRGL